MLASPMRRGARWLVVVCALLSLAVSAAPQTAGEKEAAKRFQRGVSLYKDGDYEAALAEFKQAYRLAPFYEVLYNIGLTQRRLYQYGDAVKSLRLYLEQGAAKIPQARRDLVKKELTEIRELTAEVTIEVKGDPAQVSVDGQPVGTSPLKEALLLRPGKHTFTATREKEKAEQTAELLTSSQVTITLEPKAKEEGGARLIVNSEPANAIITIDGELRGETPVVASLEPGAHTVTAEQDGYATTSTEVSLEPGQSRTITIKLVPGGTRAEVRAPRSVPLAGIIVGVAGLGLIGGAVAFNLQAQDASRQMTTLFQTGATYDGQARAIEESGHTASALSWVFGVVGGAAFTTGAIMVLAQLFGSGGDDEVSVFFGPTATGGFAATWRATW